MNRLTRAALMGLLALSATSLVAVAPVAAADPPSNSTTTNPPACRIANVPTKYHAYTDYQETLLDWIYRLPSTYAPHDLTTVSHAGLSSA